MAEQVTRILRFNLQQSLNWCENKLINLLPEKSVLTILLAAETNFFDAIGQSAVGQMRREFANISDPNNDPSPNRNPKLNTIRDEHDRTPLMFACMFGCEDVARHLLIAGANPNVSDEEGFTPLMYAAQSSNNIVLILLFFGSNIHAQDYKQRTALMHAAKVGNFSAFETLLKSGADPYMKDQKGRSARTINPSIEHELGTIIRRIEEDARQRNLRQTPH